MRNWISIKFFVRLFTVDEFFILESVHLSYETLFDGGIVLDEEILAEPNPLLFVTIVKDCLVHALLY
jgi:hypothetical protein